MKIGAISDTHGNDELMQKALNIMINQEHVEKIFHLGDNFIDGKKIVGQVPVVRVVPGLYCPEYKTAEHPNVITEEIEGWIFAMAHRREDIKGDLLKNANVILYGHTHLYSATSYAHKWYINPGHLKSPVDKGQAASFAILGIKPDEIALRILGTEGELFENKSLHHL